MVLVREELHIKDARLERVPPRHRPHYSAVERLAILEFSAAQGWSAAQTAERFFVTEATIASWMMRLDEDGPSTPVQTPEPVNKFPDLVAHLVRRLKVLATAFATARTASGCDPKSLEHYTLPASMTGPCALLPKRYRQASGKERENR